MRIQQQVKLSQMSQLFAILSVLVLQLGSSAAFLPNSVNLLAPYSQFTSSSIMYAREKASSAAEQRADKVEGKDLVFRAPKVADVDAISNLLVDCFETELKWFEFPEKESRRKRYRDMLQKSFLRRIEGADNLSFMLLVESPKENNQIIGFVQMGSLPPPPGYDYDSTIEATAANNDNDTVDDVPYIANLCVLPSCRRGGIAKKMVDVCIRWLQKKEEQEAVFIAVDYDNFVAKKFYERNQFQWIEPPSDPQQSITKVAKRDYYFRSIA